ncbi:MAG: MFS transporter [Bacillota bacterium]
MQAKEQVRARWLHQHLGLLRNGNFSLLWGATGISALGDSFFDVAVMWLVYSGTGSALQTAGVVIVDNIARTLMSLIAGTLVDRWDRRLTMVLSDFTRAFIVAIVAVIAIRDLVQPLILFGAVFLLRITSEFFSPARSAVMAELVSKGDLMTANGVLLTSRNAAEFAGSAIAGKLIAAGGSTLAFIVDSVSFLISGLAASLIRSPSARNNSPTTSKIKTRPNFASEFAGGWHVVIDNPAIRGLMLITLAVNFGGAMASPLLPAFVEKRLHAGAGLYGALQSVSIIGAVLAGVLAGLISRWMQAGFLFVTSIILSGFLMVGVSLTSSVPLALPIFLLLSLVGTISNVPTGSLIQSHIPSSHLGRAFAFLSASMSVLAPVGALIGGWVGDVLGPSLGLAMGGGLILVAGLWAFADRHVRMASIEGIASAGPGSS